MFGSRMQGAIVVKPCNLRGALTWTESIYRYLTLQSAHLGDALDYCVMFHSDYAATSDPR